MTPSQQSTGLLAEAFRKGLSLALVSKVEIVKWADEMIMSEIEPDYFFIELSLAKNSNEIMEILSNPIEHIDGLIPLRVMLALIYKRLNNADINLAEAILLMDSVYSKGVNIFTDYERDCVYQFEDEIQWMYKTDDIEKLQSEVFQFLSIYQNLKLDNYEQWQVINERIQSRFLTEK